MDIKNILKSVRNIANAAFWGVVGSTFIVGVGQVGLAGLDVVARQLAAPDTSDPPAGGYFAYTGIDRGQAVLKHSITGQAFSVACAGEPPAELRNAIEKQTPFMQSLQRTSLMKAYLDLKCDSL
ncbi:MAG: hypothetical protein H6855_06570 [Rhodospirillales bacterium]|nr:hypothetical protein [Rhodospirillales bacterium]